MPSRLHPHVVSCWVTFQEFDSVTDAHFGRQSCSILARRYTQKFVYGVYNTHAAKQCCASDAEPFFTVNCQLCFGLSTHSKLAVLAVCADPLLLERLAQMETEFGSKSPIRDADGNAKKKTEDGEDEDEDEPVEEDEDDFQDDDDYYQVRFAQAVVNGALHLAYAAIMGDTGYLPVWECLLFWHCTFVYGCLRCKLSRKVAC